jgi:adenylosuccinate synthase
MANICAVGLQWGDEGKGQIVDVLAEKADVVIRFNGGANAGHSVMLDGRKIGLHLVPSGILHPEADCYIANGVVVDPQVLIEEIDLLIGLGVQVGPANLHLSDRAHLVMPWHLAEDRLREQGLGDRKIGTTARGIGPCYADKAHRSSAIRVGELAYDREFREKVATVCAMKNTVFAALYDAEPMDADRIAAEYLEHGRRLLPFVTDTSHLLHQAVSAGRRLLFEGAHGSMLDIDHGTFPFVTSSNSTAGGVAAGSGVAANVIDLFLGVAKAYTTRVGAGPLVAELHDQIGQHIRDRGKEYGTTTGRPRRCGWFDGLATRYAARIVGAGAVCIIGLNVLSELEQVCICEAYEVDGGRLEHYPADLHVLEQATPALICMPGWQTDLAEMRSWGQLPPEAEAYVDRLEQVLGVSICGVTVGPRRDQILRRPGQAVL